MHIDTVRRMAQKKLDDSGLSQTKMAEKIGITVNSYNSFLRNNKPYTDHVPQAILEDLKIDAHTTITYHKRPEGKVK